MRLETHGLTEGNEDEVAGLEVVVYGVVVYESVGYEAVVGFEDAVADEESVGYEASVVCEVVGYDKVVDWAVFDAAVEVSRDENEAAEMLEAEGEKAVDLVVSRVVEVGVEEVVDPVVSRVLGSASEAVCDSEVTTVVESAAMDVRMVPWEISC
jgi:hypothetical protein